MFEYRVSHNLTQQQMAILMGVSVPAYNLYENRKREMPIEKIIRFLKLRDEQFDKEIIKILEKFKKRV